jgi:hypothetical protein
MSRALAVVSPRSNAPPFSTQSSGLRVGWLSFHPVAAGLARSYESDTGHDDFSILGNDLSLIQIIGKTRNTDDVSRETNRLGEL